MEQFEVFTDQRGNWNLNVISRMILDLEVEDASPYPQPTMAKIPEQKTI